MAIKNSENYLSVRWQRASSAEIAAEYTTILGFAQESDSAIDANLESQRKLLKIELLLSKANELYLARKYQQAINQYKLVQGMIYQMMHPCFPVDTSPRPGITYPVDNNLFTPLLSISMEFVEALTPKIIDSTFGPAFVTVSENFTKNLQTYCNLGINIVDGVDRSVKYYSHLASSYVQMGQWKRAEHFYSHALRVLGRPQTKEAKSAAASIYLSLGGVNVQTGKTANAKRYLARANATFKESKDTVGEAQVYLNMAAAFAKEGKHQEADAQLKLADQLIKKARGLPNPGPGNQGDTIDRITIGTPGARLKTLPMMRPDLTSVTARLETPLLKRIVGTIKLGSLSETSTAKGLAVTYRQPGKGVGWTSQEVETSVENDMRDYKKSLGLMVGNKSVEVQWQAGAVVPSGKIVNSVYRWRISRNKLEEITGAHYLPSDLAVQLPHIYFYVIPVSLGDCYHALGEYETAESYYLQAADYQYINTTIEVPALWQKLAENVLDWGDSLYKNEEFQQALNIYRKVLEPPGTAAVVWAQSPLYKHAKLKITGDKVKDMLAHYETLGVGNLNPVLASVVLEIRARIMQLDAGLDFLGIPANLVPIWSFEYLQNVARYFANQAIQAERDFINFRDRAENEELTRQQLQQAKNLAVAEQDLAARQREAYEAEKSVYEAGEALAKKRRENAEDNRSDYSAMSWERIWLNRSNAWYSSQNPWELDKKITGSGPDAGRHIHEVLADKAERLATITRDYELAAMQRQIDELKEAEKMAKEQVKAAEARVNVAKQMEAVAQLKKTAAEDNLVAFENQFFTPEVWDRMGNFMRYISFRYLHMAIRVARMMQRAYNFENDLNRHFIKTDYSVNTVKGMLAADALLADIDTFTYDLITTVKRKEIPIKHSISLQERYPFLFETQFRTTGKMNFETRLEDFDMAFPGTYARRLENLEIEIQGILPSGGVRGVLTNGGISRYRVPDINTIKFRIQPRDTLALSEYRIKNDSFIYPTDAKKLKLFEGCGTAGTWELEIPKSANDLNYNSISDIRLTFYYTARYDAKLASDIKAKLNTFAGINLGSRMFPLRWAFPDAFFHFQDTGQLAFSLDPTFFPLNQENPIIKGVSVLIITEPGTNPSGWKIRFGVPAHPATIMTQPDAQGVIRVGPGHPWNPLEAGTVTGDYLVEIRPGENPALVVDGALNLTKIRNIALIMEYEFTPRV